jgi:four helix bundle protein
MIDTSRVPLALARQRLLTATFPWYELKDEAHGPVGGFVYKRKQSKKGEEVGGIAAEGRSACTGDNLKKALKGRIRGERVGPSVWDDQRALRSRRASSDCRQGDRRPRQRIDGCGEAGVEHGFQTQNSRIQESMKYERFEQLPVRQAAIELAAAVYAITEKPAFRRRYSLRDQIERAAVSISNNIAEGFERGTNQELLTFLYVARGSAGEVRSMLCLLERIPAFADLEPDLLKLKSRAESISKQLGAWIRSLRDSDLKGERYVSEKTRRADQAARERLEFVDELERIRKGRTD